MAHKGSTEVAKRQFKAGNEPDNAREMKEHSFSHLCMPQAFLFRINNGWSPFPFRLAISVCQFYSVGMGNFCPFCPQTL